MGGCFPSGGRPTWPEGGRTFRRRTQEFWHIWPLPPVTGEVCRVVFVDGIYLSHKV